MGIPHLLTLLQQLKSGLDESFLFTTGTEREDRTSNSSLEIPFAVALFPPFDMNKYFIMTHASYFSPTNVLAEDMNPLFNEIRDLEFNMIKYDAEDENYFEIGDGNIPDFRKLWSPRTDLNRQKVD
jgi:hypothetical protein